MKAVKINARDAIGTRHVYPVLSFGLIVTLNRTLAW